MLKLLEEKKEKKMKIQIIKYVISSEAESLHESRLTTESECGLELRNRRSAILGKSKKSKSEDLYASLINSVKTSGLFSNAN